MVRRVLNGVVFCLLCMQVSLLATDSWTRVYFATFPRSGNRWTQQLIEEATGVITYRNHALLGAKACPGGGYTCFPLLKRYRLATPNDVVVIKTHFPALTERSQIPRFPVNKTLIMVRHPVDSFASYYEFQCANKKIPLTYPIPTCKIKEFIVQYRRFNEFYENKPNVSIYRYEDMLASPKEVFSQILETIGYDSISNKAIERAVELYAPFGTPLKHLHKFRAEDLQLIQCELEGYLKRFGYAIPL